MVVGIIGLSSPLCTNAKPLDLVYVALSQCYNESFTIEDCINTSDKKKEAVITHVVQSGHESVLEHVNVTFLIQNCSRVLTHQLVRHRIASYTQRSARYTKINTDSNEWYVVPSGINTKEKLKVYVEAMMSAAQYYNRLIDLGVPMEDARYVVGDGQCTNIVVTMNLRSLKHFFGERLCTRAQNEIRGMAEMMSSQCKMYFPDFFDTKLHMFDAKCIQNGFCTEKNGCGRKKNINHILENNEN